MLSQNLTDPASSPPEYQTAPGHNHLQRSRGSWHDAGALNAGRRARRLSPGDAASRRPEPECEEPGVWEARGPPVRRRGSAHIRVSAGIARAKMQEPNRPRPGRPGPRPGGGPLRTGAPWDMRAQPSSGTARSVLCLTGPAGRPSIARNHHDCGACQPHRNRGSGPRCAPDLHRLRPPLAARPAQPAPVPPDGRARRDRAPLFVPPPRHAPRGGGGRQRARPARPLPRHRRPHGALRALRPRPDAAGRGGAGPGTGRRGDHPSGSRLLHRLHGARPRPAAHGRARPRPLDRAHRRRLHGLRRRGERPQGGESHRPLRARRPHPRGQRGIVHAPHAGHRGPREGAERAPVRGRLHGGAGDARAGRAGAVGLPGRHSPSGHRQPDHLDDRRPGLRHDAVGRGAEPDLPGAPPRGPSATTASSATAGPTRSTSGPCMRAASRSSTRWRRG